MSVDKCRLEVQQVMHSSQPQSSVTAWAGWATTNPPLRNKPVIVRDQNVLGMSVCKLITVHSKICSIMLPSLRCSLIYRPGAYLHTYQVPSMQYSTMDAAVLNFASLACGCMQSFAKRLYRFMRRAMTRWPEQQPIGPLINLYLAYIAPWSVYTLTSPHRSLPCLYCPLVSRHPHLASFYLVRCCCN